MKLPVFCIDRPIFATVLNILLVIVGLISYQRLSLREYPNIDMPVVTVETTYFGANAAIIESQVTTPLEEFLSGIEGVDFMESVSRSEKSQITVHFFADRDPDDAANEVRDRVGRSFNFLPEDIETPVVSKMVADATPVIYLAFSSDRHSPMQVTDIADRVVKDRLQTLEGIAGIQIYGERRYAMRIWLDPIRLAAYDLTTMDVENALRKQNVEIPSGRVESDDREFTVLAETSLQTVEEFENIILREEGNYFVRLRDIAKVELGPEEERVNARFKGNDAVALGIIKQSTANLLEVSAAVRERLDTIEQAIPEGMSLEIAYDLAVFIKQSIHSVFQAIMEAILLVVIVIFLFLRSFKATLIPAIAIPVSLIATFSLMLWWGFSVNTLTLLAMVIAVGLVVDDAIVVLENNYRHLEEGKDPKKAAKDSIRQIVFAVISMTVTLAIVFVPMVVISGKTGKLFTEFSLTLAGAVLISGVIALTLSPMMCSLLLSKKKEENKESRLKHVIDYYIKTLSGILNYRKASFAVFAVVLLLIYGVFSILKSELAPTEDRGLLVGVAVSPEGVTLDYTDRYTKDMEDVFKTVSEIERYFMVVGFPDVSSAISFVGLAPWSDRDRSSQEIQKELAPQLFTIPGIMAFATLPPSLGQNPRAKPVEFVIQTTGSYEQLEKLVAKVMEETKNNPGIQFVETDLKLNKPELKVHVNRDKAAAVGVSVDTIGRTLETMLGGRRVTRFKQHGEQYEVMVKIDDEERQVPQDISEIYVKSQNGDRIQLGNLVTIEETIAPKELNHFNKLRSAKITTIILPFISLGEALEYLEKVTQDFAQGDVTIDYGGVSREFKQSGQQLQVMVLFALLVIYLVLAAQFESFKDPLIILFSIPFALFGALAAIQLSGGTLNVFTQIGILALLGLMTKNGILLVEFANQEKEQGKSVDEAIMAAARQRFRPILMTASSLILGVVPLVLASGAGAESRQAIGWTIIGGMAFGTFCSLFVVPIFYRILKGGVSEESVSVKEDVVEAS